MADNCWSIEHLGYGVGFRSQHYQYIIDNKPQVDFFEVITEAVLDMEGRAWECVEELGDHYRLLLHGVSLSIGSLDPLDFEYLKKLKRIAQFLDVPWISDHLCWTGILELHTHSLLPLPLTEECLKHVTERVRICQDFLEKPLALENPSTYLEFESSSMAEWEFLARLCDAADCGLLLDLNNLVVSAFNHGYDASTYIRNIPSERILYHHLAGHIEQEELRVDTHSAPVLPSVWSLYQECCLRTGGRTTVIEWDQDIPEFPRLEQELAIAKRLGGTGS